MSTYYESAKGVTITKQRAMRELSDHGEDQIQEFLNEFGDRASYNAQKVLDWLGY